MPTSTHRLAVSLIALSFAVACASNRSAQKDATPSNNYGEKQGQQAERALDAAELQLDALEVDAARQQMLIAVKALKDPEIEYYPEHEALKARFLKDRERLETAKNTRSKLAKEAVVARQEELVLNAMDHLDASLEPLQQRSFAQKDLDRAKESFHQVRDALSQGRKLELQNTTYSKFSQEAEDQLSKKRQQIVLGEGVLAFVSGPATQRQAAQSLLKSVSTTTTVNRPRVYREALAKLVACKMSGKEMLTTVDKLDRAPVKVGDEATTPLAITRYCETQSITVAKRIAEATKQAQAAQARRIGPPPTPLKSSK